MSEFKKGDRVRVTYEGEIGAVYSSLGSFDVHVDGYSTHVGSAFAKHATLIERKKPTLKAGDVVTSTVNGGVYLVGNKKAAYTSLRGEIVDGGSVEALTGLIARRPGDYKINGEVFA